MVNFQLYFQEILTFGLKISQYRSNIMKKAIFFGGQFPLKLSGQFELESGLQFERFFQYCNIRQFFHCIINAKLF